MQLVVRSVSLKLSFPEGLRKCALLLENLPSLSDPMTCVGASGLEHETWIEDPDVEKIEAASATVRSWRHVCSGRLRRKEAIHLKQAKAVVWVLRRYCRCVGHRLQRIRLLVDNVSTILASAMVGPHRIPS